MKYPSTSSLCHHLLLTLFELTFSSEQDDMTKAMEEIRSQQKKLVKELLELAPDQHMDQHSLQLLLKDAS